jgi:hypothetical protein
MSRPRQRRETEVFSLSFLDCICCGFGAIILIFILSVAQKRTIDRISVDDLQDRLRRLELQVSASKQEVERLTKLLTAAQSELPSLQKKTNESQLKLTDRKRELLALLQQTGLLKDALASLMDKKKALPTVDAGTASHPGRRSSSVPDRLSSRRGVRAFPGARLGQHARRDGGGSDGPA